MLSFHSGKIDFVHRAPICIYRHTANFTIFQGMRLNNFRTKVSNCMHETYSMASLIRCHSTGREYMSDFFCVPSRCLLVKGGRGIGKTKTGGEMRSRRSTSTSAVCFFFLSGLTLSIVWVAICSIWSTLLMFHTDIHTDGTPTHASTTAHTHTDEDESPFPASSQSPWRCLFTLHCDSFVCVCVCCVCVSIWGRRYCVSSALQG